METVEDVIVRKLTAERIDELKKLIKETQEKYRSDLHSGLYLLNYLFVQSTYINVCFLMC